MIVSARSLRETPVFLINSFDMEGVAMRSKLNRVKFDIAKLDRNKIQMLIFLISLSLLVLGAGAPLGGGGGVP